MTQLILSNERSRPAPNQREQVQGTFLCSPGAFSGCRFVYRIRNKGHETDDHIKSENHRRQPGCNNSNTDDDKKYRSDNDRQRSIRPFSILWKPITRQGCHHRTGASLLICSQVIGDYVINLGATIAVAESLDMNKHPFFTIKRRDEAKSLFIVPGCDFTFSAHVLCLYNAMHQKRRPFRCVPALQGASCVTNRRNTHTRLGLLIPKTPRRTLLPGLGHTDAISDLAVASILSRCHVSLHRYILRQVFRLFFPDSSIPDVSQISLCSAL
jgi:hypothetical protein